MVFVQTYFLCKRAIVMQIRTPSVSIAYFYFVCAMQIAVITCFKEVEVLWEKFQ